MKLAFCLSLSPNYNKIANNMEPVYVDVHIHTSEPPPDGLNQNYDIDAV